MKELRNLFMIVIPDNTSIFPCKANSVGGNSTGIYWYLLLLCCCYLLLLYRRLMSVDKVDIAAESLISGFTLAVVLSDNSCGSAASVPSSSEPAD